MGKEENLGFKPYFPLFVDLSQKKVVVVGAGTIAKRRIRSLVGFAQELIVVAPEVNQELKNLEKEGKITIRKKRYEREDIYDAAIVIAATNDHSINEDIYSTCKCLGIMVNVCNDKTKCDFYFPGIVQKENVVVGITASGTDHKKARAVTDQVKELLEGE